MEIYGVFFMVLTGVLMGAVIGFQTATTMNALDAAVQAAQHSAAIHKSVRARQQYRTFLKGLLVCAFAMMGFVLIALWRDWELRQALVCFWAVWICLIVLVLAVSVRIRRQLVA